MAQVPDDDLQKQLMSLFKAEAKEYIQTINNNLLFLEANPADKSNAQLLADTMRSAHSLKGAARAVSLNEIENLAHYLESIFVCIQDSGNMLTAEDFDQVYKVLDAINILVQKPTSGADEAVNVKLLLSKLEELLEKIQSKKTGQVSQNGGEEQKKNPKKKISTGETRKKEKANLIKEPQELKDEKKRIDTKKKNESSEDLNLNLKQAESEKKVAAPMINNPKQEETVRLTTKKLDTLLSLMDELHATRIRTKQRMVELQDLKEDIAVWEAEWRKVRSNFQHTLISSDIEQFRAESKSSSQDLKSENIFFERPVIDFLQSNETHLRIIGSQVSEIISDFKMDNRGMDRVSTELEKEVRQTRMLPISTIFDVLPRLVRDLAHERGKDILLELQGAETEVDRSVLEQLKDPLIHMVRNCVDHGIEEPDVRTKAGKNKQGKIIIKATQRGDNLVLEVADDGKGINLSTLRDVAIRKHFLSEEAAKIGDADVLGLIFKPGFSTSPIITDISGRGVGLDIVHKNIENMHGLINIENNPGKGLRFVMTVPLTVATTLCLLVQAGRWRLKSAYHSCIFAIPITNVVHLLRPTAEEIDNVEGRQVIRLNDEPIVLWQLSDVLGMEANPHEENDERKLAIVIEAAEKKMALLVDSVLGTQEIVIKKLPWPMINVYNVAGATILGTGEIIIALNASNLFSSTENKQPQVEQEIVGMGETEKKTQVVMVADDSITTRTLEKNILEAAGYKVLNASDGVEAWNKLQIESCDLLISDVIMPRMDGFDLAEKIRTDERFKHLPIILVTSLEKAEDREKGLKVGADAYIVKSKFDQELLLETVQRLI